MVKERVARPGDIERELLRLVEDFDVTLIAAALESSSVKASLVDDSSESCFPMDGVATKSCILKVLTHDGQQWKTIFIKMKAC